MLRGLHDKCYKERQYSNKPQTRQPKPVYSAQFRKKGLHWQSNSKLTQLRTKFFLYEGYVKAGLKHGEGVLMTREGMMIVGSWWQDYLHGQAVIFPPFGGRLLLTFNYGKLTGWAISLYCSELITCTKFYENHIDEAKLTFDCTEELWIASRYDDKGRVEQILHVENGKPSMLPSLMTSVQLGDMIDKYITCKMPFLTMQSLKQIEINQQLTYLGHVDEYNRPCGLGVIYSSTESFFGNYFEGSLESYGRMVFSNGEIYHGELSAGVIHGQGVYYTPGTNVSAVTQTDDGGEHFKVEAAGYVLIDIAPQLGVECDNSNSGIKGNAVTKICEGLERYYARFFVESHTQPKPVINQPKKEEFQSPVMTQLAIPNSPAVKNKDAWVNIENIDKKDLALRRMHTLSPRINHHDQAYESAVITQNSNSQQSEVFHRQEPNAVLKREITFKADDGFKSKEVHSLDQHSSSNRSRIEPIEATVSFQTEKSEAEKSVSQWGNVRVLVDKNKSNRKKIFR